MLKPLSLRRIATSGATAILIYCVTQNFFHESRNSLSASSDFDTIPPSDSSRHLDILHYNTHGGCSLNLNHVLKNVFKNTKTSYTVTQFDPSSIGYGLSHENATSLVSQGIYANQICRNHDVIVISDTIPHARGILLSLLSSDPAKRCNAKIVIELTNRFDYAITGKRDLQRYYAMFRKLAQMTTTSNVLYWVANNNFERAYMEYRLGVSMPFVRILRPLGILGDRATYSYPEDSPAPDSSRLVTLNHSQTNVIKILQKYDIPISIIPNEHLPYGGPESLRQFKGFVEFPYQVSTMKLYENLAAGVVLLVPTPRFLEQIWLNGDHAVFYFMHVLREMTPAFANFYNRNPPSLPHRAGFPDWSAFMDYYAPEFADHIIYFDSFEELGQLAEMDGNILDWRGVREKRGRFFEDIRSKSIKGWTFLFEEIRSKVLQ